MDTGTDKSTVRLIASDDSWIEGEAVRQLEATARLDGMVAAVGMPDLHPGKGHPIGAAFLSRGRIYPYLVGNDIGCGMALWQSDLPVRKIKLDKFVKKLTGLDEPWDGDPADRLEARGVPSRLASPALGTIGGGNHFAELQKVDTVVDNDTFARLGLDQGQAQVLIHSGSRGLGESILRAHTDRHGARGLDTGSDDFAAYVQAHDDAMDWASVNREVIAERFLDCLGGAARKVLDNCHNSVTPAPDGDAGLWLHRKGAAPSTEGPVAIPGSRGAITYLVAPQGGQDANAWSLAHGAGRRWTRSESKARLSKRFRPQDLTRTDLGGRVICTSKDLLYEEAPQAYKDIESVIADLTSAGLITVIATLRPVITYKTRRQ
ncbi:MAG: RNA ligase RtcB family protein [Hyphomicrobiales bacterium]